MVSIKTIMILNVILLFLTLMYYFRVEITGFVSDAASVFLNIGGISVELSIYKERVSFCPGERATITNILENTGVQDTSGNLSTNVSAPGSGHFIVSEYWNNIDLEVGEIKEFDIILDFTEDNTTGLYSIQSSFVYNEVGEYPISPETDSSSIRFQKGIGTLTASPPQIEKTIKRGNSKTETISMWLRYACENTNVIVNVSSAEPGNWTNISSDVVFLTPAILNTTEVNITVPRETNLGDYLGEITLTAGDQKITIPLLIHVIRRDLEINVTVTAPDEKVCLGEVVDSVVNITKTLLEGELLLNATYQILDPDSIIVANNSEQVLVENSVLRYPDLSVPETSNVGIYTYLVTVQYEEITDQNSDIFEVIDCSEDEDDQGEDEGGGGGGGGGAPAGIVEPLNYSMKLELSTDLLSSIPGDKETILAKVTNDGNVDLESVRLSVEGVPLNWIKITPNEVNIYESSFQEYLIVLDIPNNAGVGIYEIKVKAVGIVETETKIVKLIIGGTLEELADLLLEEMEERRAIAKRAIKTDACLDLSRIIPIFNEAERAREKGLQDYKSKNWEKAIDWFEHAIKSYNKVIDQVDVKIEVKIDELKKEKIGIFPILGLKKQVAKLEDYYSDRNYGRICEPIIEIARLRRLSLILWVLCLVILIILIISFYLIYRRRRVKARGKVIRRVRERLGKLEPSTTEQPRYLGNNEPVNLEQKEGNQKSYLEDNQ